MLILNYSLTCWSLVYAAMMVLEDFIAFGCHKSFRSKSTNNVALNIFTAGAATVENSLLTGVA